MKKEQFLKTLEETFLSLGNAAIGAQQSAYMKNHFPFLGIKKPLRDAHQKGIFQQFPPDSEEELIEVINCLWKYEQREYHYAALDFAHHNRKLLSPAIFVTFEALIRQKSWWDSVDFIAANLVGTLAQKHPELAKTMDRWIQDDNMWIRRTALLFQLKWKTKTDADRLFRYCKLTMHEKEFFIRKAIGWALREYSKTNPTAVKIFIANHENQMSGLSKREGSKLLG